MNEQTEIPTGITTYCIRPYVYGIKTYVYVKRIVYVPITNLLLNKLHRTYVSTKKKTVPFLYIESKTSNHVDKIRKILS